MAGYSGTPLAKKLGIKPSTKVFVSSAPENYVQLVSPLPAGVHLVRRLGSETDMVHIFATKRARLSEALQGTLAKMKPDAAIWVSWPKKASQVQTDITEDTIREVALPMGLVDIKVCAVDDTWSGLKLVLRKEKRKSR
jgi:streptogramin lyase